MYFIKILSFHYLKEICTKTSCEKETLNEIYYEKDIIILQERNDWETYFQIELLTSHHRVRRNYKLNILWTKVLTKIYDQIDENA